MLLWLYINLLEWYYMSIVASQITGKVFAFQQPLQASNKDSHHKGPVLQKVFPCHDMIMITAYILLHLCIP